MDQRAAIGCPRCSTFLRKERMRKLAHPSGATLDVCDACGGMWLDKDEVKLLHRSSTSQSGKGTGRKTIKNKNKRTR
ncbi:TPA: zf-TFIIB domain-containing protein [Candidatus Woesearchaeota archaeon]|nr:zf-TFIIB domain-containing protein [Candidatus Woesearchaeota archaeon]HIH91666.1 zf-TFIIB domain-containing protein [Candidatus Woesearchaeota archaeon]HIJ18100.1 zf-TFIIB domain-containing protein [Candidatus Woesearchaeota archaeon]